MFNPQPEPTIDRAELRRLVQQMEQAAGLAQWSRARDALHNTFPASAILTLLDKIERLEGALKPFAEACCHLHPSQPDDGETLDGFKVHEFRIAALALGDPS